MEKSFTGPGRWIQNWHYGGAFVGSSNPNHIAAIRPELIQWNSSGLSLCNSMQYFDAGLQTGRSELLQFFFDEFDRNPLSTKRSVLGRFER